MTPRMPRGSLDLTVTVSNHERGRSKPLIVICVNDYNDFRQDERVLVM